MKPAQKIAEQQSEEQQGSDSFAKSAENIALSETSERSLRLVADSPQWRKAPAANDVSCAVAVFVSIDLGHAGHSQSPLPIIELH